MAFRTTPRRAKSAFLRAANLNLSTGAQILRLPRWETALLLLRSIPNILHNSSSVHNKICCSSFKIPTTIEMMPRIITTNDHPLKTPKHHEDSECGTVRCPGPAETQRTVRDSGCPLKKSCWGSSFFGNLPFREDGSHHTPSEAMQRERR